MKNTLGAGQTEHGSKPTATNALEANRATLTKHVLPLKYSGPGLVTGGITGDVVPQRHFVHTCPSFNGKQTPATES